MSAATLSERPVGPHAAIATALLRATRRAALAFAAGALMVLAMTAVLGGASKLALVAPAVGAGCVVFLWWASFSGLQSQNHPHAARLVPGHLRRLREIAVGVYLVLAVLGGWLVSLLGVPLAIWTAAAGGVLLGCALTIRWPVLWIIMGVASAASTTWVPQDLRQALAASGYEVFALHSGAYVALTLLLAAGVIWHLLQGGGPAHDRQWQRARIVRQVVREQAIEGRPTSHVPETRMGRSLVQLFAWLRAWWREHLLRTARPTARSAMARAELGANPSGHWSTLVGSAIAMIVMMLSMGACFWVVNPGSAAAFGVVVMPGLSFGLFSLLLNPVLGMGPMLYKRRREQALLMLLPGMPRGQAFNRMWARRQMWQFLLCLGFGVAVVLLIQWAVGGAEGPSRFLIALGLNYASVAVPSSLFLWKDWSRQREPGNSGTLLRTLLIMVGVGSVAGVSAFLHLSPWLPLGCSIALTAVLVIWRWRIVTNSPTFWPIARWS